MKSKSLLFLIIVSLVSSAFLFSTKKESGYAIALKMFEKTASINSLTYTITKQERIDGKMRKQKSFTKMEKSPFKVYVRQLSPKEGVEVLYVTGESKKALINPNGFPWINLKLNPMEGIMRNNQHHTLFQSGFDHVASILEFLSKKYSSTIEDMIVYNGIVTHGNQECYSISLENPSFKYINYTIGENETITDVADRYKLSEHMILEKNPSINDYDDVKEGQQIIIPNDYSPKMLLYIDKDEFVPIRMDVYDDLGLYEQYEYSDITIDPKIPSDEFSPDYPGYNF